MVMGLWIAGWPISVDWMMPSEDEDDEKAEEEKGNRK